MSLRDRLRSALGGTPAATPADVGDDDAMPVVPPLECGEREIHRWNEEWIQYLRREWPYQLTPHSAYPETPPLPSSARALIDLGLGHLGPLSLYCDADALAGRRVMEMGCGCGNLGKLLGRYVASYLGTDYSTLALAVARLVSPGNCTYLHVADRGRLESHFGTVDTVVGRYFWIHQNAELAGHNLDFLARFLAPGGRLYADFYWPDPKAEQAVVFTPDHPLSRRYPSATFRYDRADVDRLIAGRPFEVLREEIVPEMQRRYVVLLRRG